MVTMTDEGAPQSRWLVEVHVPASRADAAEDALDAVDNSVLVGPREDGTYVLLFDIASTSDARAMETAIIGLDALGLWGEGTSVTVSMSADFAPIE